MPTPLTARLIERIHEVERGAGPARSPTSTTLGVRSRAPLRGAAVMNVDFSGRTVDRDRRRPRLRPGHRPGLRGARGAQVWACDVLEDELAPDRGRRGRATGARPSLRRSTCATGPPSTSASPTQWRGSGHGGRPGQQCGRRAGPGGPSARSGDPRGMAGDLRRQRLRRLLLLPGRGARDEGGAERVGSSTSRAARASGISLTGIQAYASAKAAQIGLTRQLAHELGPWGITVNNIAPGFVRSNPTTERQWRSYGDEGQRALVDGSRSSGLAPPRTSRTACCSSPREYAGWITGQVLSIDGGK